jgi:hypothetical protein
MIQMFDVFHEVIVEFHVVFLVTVDDSIQVGKVTVQVDIVGVGTAN